MYAAPVAGKHGGDALQGRVGGCIRRRVHGDTGNKGFDEDAGVRQRIARGFVCLGNLAALNELYYFALKRCDPFAERDAGAVFLETIQRIEKVNPQLNAVVWERFEKAREEARSAGLPKGPFSGVPFLTKDLGCTTAGEPDSGGSRFLKENGYIASVTTELARRIKAAGFINLGRTNSPEFGYTAFTTNDVFGTTRNPWNLERTPGGSSGGSAAAIATGMAPLATASDGGGSIRIPACFVGAFGLKPTFGLVPVAPRDPLPWIDFTVYGPLTRTVRDAALYLQSTTAHDGFFSGSALFAYKINWQSVMFFGYGDDRTLDQQRRLQKFDRQMFVKLSYAFQR